MRVGRHGRPRSREAGWNRLASVWINNHKDGESHVSSGKATQAPDLPEGGEKFVGSSMEEQGRVFSRGWQGGAHPRHS